MQFIYTQYKPTTQKPLSPTIVMMVVTNAFHFDEP